VRCEDAQIDLDSVYRLWHLKDGIKALIPRAIRLSHGGVRMEAQWFALSPQKALAGGPTLEVLAAKIISGRRSPPAHITKHC
jgi:hypothetical protein